MNDGMRLTVELTNFQTYAIRHSTFVILITMIMKIERDQRRFRQIVRGRIRQNLAKVRHARRDDRPQGSRSRQHSGAAARCAPFPVRRQRGRGRRAG